MGSCGRVGRRNEAAKSTAAREGVSTRRRIEGEDVGGVFYHARWFGQREYRRSYAVGQFIAITIGRARADSHRFGYQRRARITSTSYSQVLHPLINSLARHSSHTTLFDANYSTRRRSLALLSRSSDRTWRSLGGGRIREYDRSHLRRESICTSQKFVIVNFSSVAPLEVCSYCILRHIVLSTINRARRELTLFWCDSSRNSKILLFSDKKLRSHLLDSFSLRIDA